MPEVRITITLEQDGQTLPNFPITRALSDAEVVPLGTIQAAPDNNTTSFHPIAAATMPAMGVIFLTMDQAMNLKFNLNTQVPMNSGGLMLLFGCNLTQATPTQNIEYNNPSGAITANLTGIVGGT